MESFSSAEKPLIDYFFHSLRRALESLKSAEILFREGQFNSCVSNSYYTAFHVARGLLALKGVTGLRKHSGVKSFFSHYYVRSGEVEAQYAKLLSELERERIAADYDVEYSFSQEQAKKELEKARKFLLLGLKAARKVSKRDRDFFRDYLELEKAAKPLLNQKKANAPKACP